MGANNAVSFEPLASMIFLFILLITRAVPSHGYRSAYSRSRYSDFGKMARPNHLSMTADNEYSQIHPSREARQKQAALRWEQTKTGLKESLELRKKEQKLGYYYTRVFYVRDYGADPTGVKDSTAALQKTVNEAFKVGDSRDLVPGVADLGGVEIHLEGGDYLISKPIQFSSLGGGNLRMHGGTIRASDDFPEDHYLIELWSSEGIDRRSNRTTASLRDRMHHSISCLKDYSVSYEDITFRDLMLDSNFRGGGLLLVDCLRITVDNLYISHFATDGILVEGSHEIYIQNSFLGQCITQGGDPHEEDINGVAINIISNDNVISNVVIFSGAIGVEVSGQGNLLTGVHAYNKATYYGGIGIYLQLPGYTQTRIVNSYLDYTGIVAEDPAQLDISHNYFNGDANVVLRSTKMEHSIEQVNIVNNMFAGTWRGTPIVELDEKKGAFGHVEQTLVDQNTAYGMTLKATVARATVSGYGKKYTVDMSERLLFPDLIQNVQYSLYVPSSNIYPRHVIRSVGENKVMVETDNKVSGTVTVLVDQSSDVLYSSTSVSS